MELHRRQDRVLCGHGADRRVLRVADACACGRRCGSGRADSGELRRHPKVSNVHPHHSRRRPRHLVRRGGHDPRPRRCRRLSLGFRREPVGGVLQAAGLLFFAFAGYARIATLGEEVRDPPARSPARSRSRSASRWSCTRRSPPLRWPIGRAASASARRRSLRRSPRRDAGFAPVVRVAAGVAALGALLALIAGCPALPWRWRATTSCRGAGPRASAIPRPHLAELAVGASSSWPRWWMCAARSGSRRSRCCCITRRQRVGVDVGPQDDSEHRAGGLRATGIPAAGVVRRGRCRCGPRRRGCLRS